MMRKVKDVDCEECRERGALERRRRGPTLVIESSARCCETSRSAAKIRS